MRRSHVVPRQSAPRRRRRRRCPHGQRSWPPARVPSPQSALPLWRRAPPASCIPRRPSAPASPTCPARSSSCHAPSPCCPHCCYCAVRVGPISKKWRRATSGQKRKAPPALLSKSSERVARTLLRAKPAGPQMRMRTGYLALPWLATALILASMVAGSPM